jgi:Holliday junction resolvasome RuvABC endonuclease subunit
MANVLAKGPKRFLLEAFRGIGKSWITVAFAIWCLGTEPDWKILVVSASKQAADEFSTFCLRLIREMPDLEWLIPSDDGRDSKLSFDVRPAQAAKAPSMKSLGITSQLAGSRADLIIADDIEVPANSMTPGMREKLSEQVKEFDAIIKPEAHCRIVFLGTPQTEDSVYNKLQQRGYVCRIWPARFPTEEEIEEYGSRLADSVLRKLGTGPGCHAGDPTDPGRFTDLDLRERALSYGIAGYARQFQLRTRLSDAERYPIKVHDLIMLDVDKLNAPEKPIWSNDPTFLLPMPMNLAMEGDKFYRPMALVGKWIPYSGIVMSIDPSGRGKDETGYAVIAMLNGFLYVLACGGLQGGYDEHVLRKLAEIAAKFKVNHVIIEANFGDGMYTKLFQPILAKYWSVTCEEVKHSIQKEKRLCDTLEPVIQGHRLIFDIGVIEHDYQDIQRYGHDTALTYSLVHQLTRLTREKGALVHDDRIDALAIAVAYWVEQMAADADQEQLSYKADLLDKELEKFTQNVFNERAPKERLWTETMR